MRGCRAGYAYLCPNMNYPWLGSAGNWADYLLVPHARYLVPLGDLDPLLAAPLTDGGLTSFTDPLTGGPSAKAA